MKRILIAALLAVLLVGCGRQVTVQQPDGSIVITDRVIAIANSDMGDGAKLEAIRQIVERERGRGANIMELLRDSAVAAVIGAAIR